MTQIQKKKKKKKGDQFWKKKTLQITFFTLVLTIAREMAKIKVKNPDKMCQLIVLKIQTQQQKQWHKNLLYFY